MMTHRQLIEDLADHLRGASNRLVWADMQMGPAGSRRPDLFTLEKSYVRFSPMAYEVKASVADFRRDITEGKWRAYLEYAAGVWFAAPSGMVSKDDVPPGCGLVVRGPAGWRPLRKPTLANKDNLPRDAWIKLVLDGCERGAKSVRHRGTENWNTESEIRRKYGKELSAALHDRDRSAGFLMASKARFDAEIKELEQRLDAERERCAQLRKAEMADVQAAKDELAAALGLPSGSPLFAIREAAREQAVRLRAGSEAVRLSAAIDRIRQIAEEAADCPHIAQM